VEEQARENKLGLAAAVAVIAACMIGTGVFTSLGYQVIGIKSTFAVVVLWLVGGLVALCGALVYGELAVRLPGSGGEYNYLSKIYHPALGFLSGWTSATIGFAAPIAASAMAFSKYFSWALPSYFEGMSEAELKNAQLVVAMVLVLLAALVNFMKLSWSSLIQSGTTYLNLFLIVVLIVCGFFIAGDTSHFSFSMEAVDFEAIASHSFAVSLIYVSYAFSGWNAVTYVAGEVKSANKNVPRSLILSVVLVATLYVLLNFVFLYRVPMEELAGQNEVGAIAAQAIFGDLGGQLISAMICLGLLASVLGMTLAGPRVSQQMGQDLKGLRFWAISNKAGAPYMAVIIQSVIALALIYTASFDAVIRYVGFTLALFTCLTVVGLLVLRTRQPASKGYRLPLYPLPAVIFILLELWMLVYTMIDHPKESFAGLATLLLGLIVYFLAKGRE